MTIHRLTSNIVFFALGLNIALASAFPITPTTYDCDVARECTHPELTVGALKISRPVRFREDMAAGNNVAGEIAAD